METYEVRYQVCPTKGNAIFMTNTVETSSPEHAKKITYSMVFKNKPSKAKVKFMYVRKLNNLF